jgi:hypothetical protein
MCSSIRSINCALDLATIWLHIGVAAFAAVNGNAAQDYQPPAFLMAATAGKCMCPATQGAIALADPLASVARDRQSGS